MINKIERTVAVDGMDGAGKRTQTMLLQSRLKEKGYDYELVAFPHYESYSGSLVRDYLQNNKGVNKSFQDIQDDSLLYTFNRFQYFTENGHTVGDTRNYILDRHTTSNMLYQTLDMDLDYKRDYIEWISRLEYDILKLPKPDIVIVLRCSETLVVNNIKARGRETDFFESVYMQGKVRGNIDYFVKEHGWIPVDVDRDGQMRDINEINDEILQHILHD